MRRMSLPINHKVYENYKDVSICLFQKKCTKCIVMKDKMAQYNAEYNKTPVHFPISIHD